jgi:hypothetical protein
VKSICRESKSDCRESAQEKGSSTTAAARTPATTCG